MLFLLPASFACGVALPQVTVQRQHTDDSAYFEVHASAFTHASQERVWQQLTDYQRQPDYVPNLTSARIVARNGSEVVLDQEGRGGFFFFKRALHLQVHVQETQKSAIDVTLVSGDMKRYTAHWRISPAEVQGESGTQIDYEGSLEPNFFVPPMIGNAIVLSDIRKMLAAVIDELEKSVKAAVN